MLRITIVATVAALLQRFKGYQRIIHPRRQSCASLKVLELAFRRLMSLGSRWTNWQSVATLLVAFGMEIKFTWSAAKAKRNLRLHGISFEQAKQVFDDSFYLTTTDCDIEGELRLHAIGRVKSQTLVVVAFIDETADENIHFHIIMARKAEASEEFFYAQQFN